MASATWGRSRTPRRSTRQSIAFSTRCIGEPRWPQRGCRTMRTMHIAILTFDGFNELDSLVALNILNRVKQPRWRVSLCCPTRTVTSMNGVTVHAQSTLAEANDADVVLAGSGARTREVVRD